MHGFVGFQKVRNQFRFVSQIYLLFSGVTTEFETELIFRGGFGFRVLVSRRSKHGEDRGPSRNEKLSLYLERRNMRLTQASPIDTIGLVIGDPDRNVARVEV